MDNKNKDEKIKELEGKIKNLENDNKRMNDYYFKCLKLINDFDFIMLDKINDLDKKMDKRMSDLESIIDRFIALKKIGNDLDKLDKAIETDKLKRAKIGDKSCNVKIM